jgi:ATP-dependent Lon protease
MDFETTANIKIPTNPFDKIIGQDDVVRIAHLAPRQRRHLLLVGPPGTGKSMIAQAIASVLSKPRFEISVLQNPENPERPIAEARLLNQIDPKQNQIEVVGLKVSPLDVPTFVSERLGFRCRRCSASSDYTILTCPSCGADKFSRSGFVSEPEATKSFSSVTTRRRSANGSEEELIYERRNDGTIILLNQREIRRVEELKKKSARKVIVPFNRSTFIQASGANETELLGDVRHDPYGSHHQLGTPAFERVVAGAVHEAHEGVLFVDELSTLGNVQRYLLTAMQDKVFSIVGRNPTSSGAMVRVDAVPCDFLLVGAVNINDLQTLLPALRSRIRGEGYEVLMNSFMPDTEANIDKFYQFVAQEIQKDGRIPHASRESAEEFLLQAEKIAKAVDNAKGISLRLRNISGLIKLSGDFAVSEASPLIEKRHVIEALKFAKSIEQQVSEKYSNWWDVNKADHGSGAFRPGAETG